METSEYEFSYEPYRRVPMNSATTHKDFTDYSSMRTLSTYSSRAKSIKQPVTTTYIDGTTMLGHCHRPYSMKDIFPKGKGRRKPSNSLEKKMDARDAYMSLLPTDASTIRSEKTRSSSSIITSMQSSNLPEVSHKIINNQNKRSSYITIFDDNSDSKFYAQCATTHGNDAWVRRYKSINTSQTLSNLLRDQSYRDKLIFKKRSYQQLLAFSSPSFNSSLIKRRREQCY